MILSWRIEFILFTFKYISNFEICIHILTCFVSLYWDIDQVQVGTHDTCHTVSHNVTWRPCQISWQPCHFIINFIYKSKYLITKENIQCQWFLDLQIYLFFSCLTNCEVCPPGWHINVLSTKFSSQAPKTLFFLKFNLLVNLRTSVRDFSQQISRRLSSGQKSPCNTRIMLIACGL